MKKVLLCILIAVCAQTSFAQFVYKIKADSVLITRDSCTAELIIENSTKNVSGFLYNKGNGRTEFRKAERLNDSTLVIGGDTIVIQGTVHISASNGLSLTGREVKLGQNIGEAGVPAMLYSDREIPLNAKKLVLSGSGKLLVGADKGSAATFQVNNVSKGPTLAVGDFLTDDIYNTFHSIDTVTASNFNTIKSRLFQFQRRLRIQDNNLTLSDKEGGFISLVVEAKDSVRLNPNSSALMYGNHSSITLQKFPGFTGRSRIRGGTFDFDVPTGQLGVISVNGVSSTNNIKASGYWSAFNAFLRTTPYDTVENYIGFYNTGSNLGRLLKGYNFVGGQLPNTDSMWGVYMTGNNVLNYFEGKMGIGKRVPIAKLDVAGTGFFTDTLTATTINNADSSNVVASTAFVKRQAYQKKGEEFVKRTTINNTGYTALTTDYLIAFTALTASRTVTLPSATGMTDRIMIIKDESGAASTNNITVNVSAGGTIDGVTSKLITTNYGSIEVYSNGSQWFVK